MRSTVGLEGSLCWGSEGVPSALRGQRELFVSLQAQSVRLSNLSGKICRSEDPTNDYLI
jgi:hypothetical protein